FLEDHCYIQQWQHSRSSQMILNKSIHNCFCPMCCRHGKLEFYSDNYHRPLIAYTTSPHALVHNSLLSVICKNAKQVDLKGSEETQRFFITYFLYIILFTVTMLRNRQSEYFYRNYDRIKEYDQHIYRNAKSCEAMAQWLVQLNFEEALAQPADHVLKTLVIVLL
ncbi:unnamed protein product, partial [Rotaria magnacalcarata]